MVTSLFSARKSALLNDIVGQDCTNNERFDNLCRVEFWSLGNMKIYFHFL